MKVYEAVIEDKGKNVVYLRLSAVTVTDLKLKPDTSVTLEMQFQLNRIPFCEWHQAVDCVSNYSIIFPDVMNIPVIPKISEKFVFSFRLLRCQVSCYVLTLGPYL